MLLSTYDISFGIVSFMNIFQFIWNFIVNTKFTFGTISVSIFDITVGIWLGCIGVWIIRKGLID